MTDKNECLRAKRPWMKIIFVLSLAVNLLFLGFSAMAIWKISHFRGEKHGMGKIEHIARYMLKPLPPARRQELMQLIEDHKGVYMALARKNEAAHDELRKTLQAEPFQPEAIKKILTSMANVRQLRRKWVGEMMVEVMAKMTPAERKAFLKGRFFRRYLRKGKHYK